MALISQGVVEAHLHLNTKLHDAAGGGVGEM